MKVAWIMVTADRTNRSHALIELQGCEIPHLANAAALLDDYAEHPTSLRTIAGAGEFHGKPYGETDAVATLDFVDDEVSIEIHGTKLKPFHARAAAFFLRNQATYPLMQQAAAQGFVQARQMLEQGLHEQEIVKKILVPGNGGRTS